MPRIYRSLGGAGPWGISALSKLGPSGLDYEKLSPEMRRTINNLPAMLYHGVSTENAVLMRMNGVPRTVAERLGEAFQMHARVEAKNARHAREFLRSLEDADWERLAPANAQMSGGDYRSVWAKLSGEHIE